jgi:putative NADH-flavin reductase
MTTGKTMRLLILGATGGTGRELVEQGLARRHRITALVRSPERLGEPRPGLTVLPGDPLGSDAIVAALPGHDAVLSTIGPPGPGRTTVARDSARAIVTAMKATGARRLLVVSVGVLFDDAGLLGAALRKTFMRGIADDAAEMERTVEASDLEWTIVRPPRLTNGPCTERYAVRAGSLPVGAGGLATIRRSDLAHFMLDEAARSTHLRQIVGIAASKTASEAQYVSSRRE